MLFFVYTLLLHNGVATKFACCCHIYTHSSTQMHLYRSVQTTRSRAPLPQFRRHTRHKQTKRFSALRLAVTNFNVANALPHYKFTTRTNTLTVYYFLFCTKNLLFLSPICIFSFSALLLLATRQTQTLTLFLHAYRTLCFCLC